MKALRPNIDTSSGSARDLGAAGPKPRTARVAWLWSVHTPATVAQRPGCGAPRFTSALRPKAGPEADRLHRRCRRIRRIGRLTAIRSYITNRREENIHETYS